MNSTASRISPSIVVVASTMRSGSTLLKALLAEADDVLSLPETNFQNQKTVERVLASHESGTPPIKVLKKPAWYNETKSYPRLPVVENLKTVVLIRDVYETVLSLRKMTFRWFAHFSAPWVTKWLAATYWVRVTSSLLELSESSPSNVMLIRYEDLVANPMEQTRMLYEFMGSSRTTGTETYSPPENYSWKWGSDDGSSNIKSLTVQPPREKKREEKRLVDLMKNNNEIGSLRRRLGYE